MNMATLAAQAILTRAQRQSFDPTDTLILAAASSVLNTQRPPGEDIMRQIQDPALTFLLRSAVAAYLPAGSDKREALLALGLLVLDTERRTVLASTERFLARIDPVWAWSCIETLLGVEAAATHGSLGLDIAAQLDTSGDLHWQWPSTWLKANSPFLRQLRADAVARAATHGHLTSKNAPELALLSQRSPETELLSFEAASYLVAAAAIEPQWALEMAGGVLRIYPPEDILDALMLLGQAAARRGRAAALLQRMDQATFIAEQAHWTLVAASAGVLNGQALTQHVAHLAPRVLDELDPERELIAGLPLLMALTYDGSLDLLTELALTWHVPAPLLVQRLFHEQLTHPLPDLSQLLQALLALPEDEWNATYSYDAGWWLAAGETIEERLAACRDVLALQKALPWQVQPGSLADVTHWSVLS